MSTTTFTETFAATCRDGSHPFTYLSSAQVEEDWGPRLYCDEHGGTDTEPCIGCFVPVPLDAECYAVDGAIVCAPCGKRRYGDRAEYLITTAPKHDGRGANIGERRIEALHIAAPPAG